MKNYQLFIALITVLLSTGCASVPTQVVEAIEVQQKEIENVKEIYFTNLHNQLDAIEKYRLTILDIYEKQFIAENSKALDQVNVNGEPVIQEVGPTGNPNVDHINIGKLNDIQSFFESQRKNVREDIKNRRELINKANMNFENIEQINSVVNDYFQSLKRLKRSRDKLAQAIKEDLKGIVQIPVSFPDFPNSLTFEELLQNLNSTN